MKRVIFWVFLSFAFVLSCVPKNKTSSSNVQWGHLSGYSTSAFLVAVPPNSSISVCGPNRADIADSIREWARAIDRDSRLNINSDCKSATVVIQAYGVNDEDPRSVGCKGKTSTGGDIAAYTLVYEKKIKFCVNYSGQSLHQLILHEVGHLWGMCDQYGHAVNCDSNNKGPQDKSSVMGSEYKATALTKDDIEGIKNLAARTDVPYYDEWRQVAGTSPTPGRVTPAPGSIPPENMTNAEKCAAAGGTWGSFGINDGAMRCDCGNMLYHESVMGSYTLDQLRRLCGGGTSPTSTPRSDWPTPNPGTPTPSPQGNTNDLASWCREAGGTYDTFGQTDGMYRCSCPNNYWIREDAMRYFGKDRFMQECRR